MDQALVAYFQGFAIGLAIAMPVGPLNILCITRVLKGGFAGALPVLTGTALADATFAAMAAFGLSVVSDFLVSEQFWFKLFGGLVLLWMGFRALTHPPHIKEAPKVKALGFMKDVVVILGITLSSPFTIITFTALFSALGPEVFQGGGVNPMVLVFGVFTGTSSWMLTLTSITVLVRKKVGDEFLNKINRVGGAILIVFASGLFLSL